MRVPQRHEQRGQNEGEREQRARERTDQAHEYPQQRQQVDLELDGGEVESGSHGVQTRAEQPAERRAQRLIGARILRGRFGRVHQRRPMSSPSSSATPPATATACQGLPRT